MSCDKRFRASVIVCGMSESLYIKLAEKWLLALHRVTGEGGHGGQVL